MKKSDTITISSWFQRAPTSAWEEPVFIPRGKSPVTSNSSLTLAFTTVIKSKILSSKRSSSLPTAVVLLTDAENFHILGLSSFIILRISCYWIITSVWAGASSVLAGTPQQSGSGAQEDPPFLPALVAIAMGSSRVSHKAPRELPWKSESHYSASAGCQHWIPLCHPSPRQKKPRNPNLLLHHRVFSISQHLKQFLFSANLCKVFKLSSAVFMWSIASLYFHKWSVDWNSK